jgi:hypothetical protein
MNVTLIALDISDIDGHDMHPQIIDTNDIRLTKYIII